MSFELPKLPYDYQALEPWYDAETVKLHHDKHHQTYTDNLNKAVQEAKLEGKTIESLLTAAEAIPDAFRTRIINQGGGYWNHNFFWESMTPKGGVFPAEGKFAKALIEKWKTLDAFKEAFAAKALAHFGSGWAWLVLDKNGDLQIIDTHDQASPLSQGFKALLTIDVWEHAYYLKFKNVRAEWIKSWWNIVNWEKVEARFNEATGTR
ncbi:MAG: superoxide dismutase [Fibrobacter sp.]|jgi:Fe-Mn family superoxide dismutase|nr:superoxide dismutase [Fibrobacter sp.]